ncbi:hypothetical protein tb265_24540 [Gemmatimonadetes bacterium T265]|nr:hypothetical protein tb265_24540 [Gemmatimonadetes bacterium T265]
MTGPAASRTGDEPDAPDMALSPEVRRAVDALRQLPPTSPEAVARVVAAAAADRAARPSRTNRARGRRRVIGALAAAAAVGGLLVVTERWRARVASPTPVPIARATETRGAHVPLLPAVGSAADAASGDAASGDAASGEAPRPVTFVLARPDARAVAVVGDFNRWDARAAPLARRPDGAWAVTLALTPGRHAYRFVIDDSLRVLDPRAPAERDAELGVARSIVVVGTP